jgi:hypothetical protein
MSHELTFNAPTIAQYPDYQDLLSNSEQVPLQEFQLLNANQMPRFADGLFDSPPGPGLRRKRKRLSDFSEKEKQARRKLKNRIAAQSARDRKRFEADQTLKNMSELDLEVKRLREDNRILRHENQQLREDNSGLRQDNMILRNQDGGSGSPRTRSPELTKRRRFSNQSEPNSQKIAKTENLYSSPGYYSGNTSRHNSGHNSPNSGSFPSQNTSFDSGMQIDNSQIGNSKNQMYNFPASTKTVSETTRKPSDSVSNNTSSIVDPSTTAVEQFSSHLVSSKNINSIVPADGLPMPQGREVTQQEKSSQRTEVIRTTNIMEVNNQGILAKKEKISVRATKKSATGFRTTNDLDSQNTKTATFEQMQALYTLVMTILFQTAGTMIAKQASQSQSSSRELSRRLRAVQNLKQVRRLASPLNFWETQNLKNQETPVEKVPNVPDKTASPITGLPQPFYHQTNLSYPSANCQHPPCPDKSQTTPFSTTSSETSAKTAKLAAPTTSTPSFSTKSERQTSSTGGKGLLKSKTQGGQPSRSPLNFKEMQDKVSQDLKMSKPNSLICPVHASKTQNCLACECKEAVTLSPELVLKINISDHLLRQATQAVQRKRKLQSSTHSATTCPKHPSTTTRVHPTVHRVSTPQRSSASRQPTTVRSEDAAQ